MPMLPSNSVNHNGPLQQSGTARGRSTRPYSIGVIGAGARGEVFARQLYGGHPRATLFGVCDIDAQRLQTFCEYCQLENARRFTDAEEFFNHPELDAVVITTPEFTHAPLAVRALRAGKHIYLEKPMANTSAACREIADAARDSNAVAFLGFNLRATAPARRLKQIADSGVLGQIVHISAFEHLSIEHGAAFMRRFHRHSSRSGGLLNHKCSHDLDLMQWLIGYKHKIKSVASFGGCSVFTPDKEPAKYCRDCPQRTECPYADRAGFVFPVGGERPLHHPKQEIYGGDLCVYTADKDIVDNQTLIMEWEHGVRGSFNLQMFGHGGHRHLKLWGELGTAEYNSAPQETVRLRFSRSGETVEHNFPPRGGHGGSDVQMIDLFLDAIESGGHDSGLGAGLATTLLAERADEARLQNQVVNFSPEEYL